MSWVTDGQDGNGLQLEKIRPFFFKFIALRLGKLAKTQIMVDFLFENSRDIFLQVSYKRFVSDKCP